MKTRHQFIKMPDELKATYLMDHGKFIIRKAEDDFASDLYAIHDYFVEVIYDYKQHNIVGFRVANDFESIDKYLEIINICILV